MDPKASVLPTTPQHPTYISNGHELLISTNEIADINNVHTLLISTIGIVISLIPNIDN